MKLKDIEIEAAEMEPPTSLNQQSEILNPEYDEPWVTKAQLMAHFGMGERTVERYLHDHNMPCHFVGRRCMRFKISEVQVFLEQHGFRRFAAVGRSNTIQKIKQTATYVASLHGLPNLTIDIR